MCLNEVITTLASAPPYNARDEEAAMHLGEQRAGENALGSRRPVLHIMQTEMNFNILYSSLYP